MTGGFNYLKYMSAEARFALLIGLSNIPENEDWEVLNRICKLLYPTLTNTAKSKIVRLLNKKEPYTIPELLSLLTLDSYEYNHLMSCMSQNGLENYRSRNKNNEKIHEAAEYYRLE